MRRILKDCRLVLAAILLLAPVALFASDSNIVVAVTGDVPKPHSYTLTELQSLPVMKVTAKDRDGTNAEYTGIAVQELLRLAGAPAGEGLRGARALTKVVVAHATDGFQAAFSLAELDPAMTGQPAVLAWSRNSEPLAANAGPLRLVVPGDKHPARWVRQVTALEVVSLNRPALTNAAAATLVAPAPP